MIVSIWRNLLCLSAGKKSTSSFTFSLRYLKDVFTKLWIWVLLACLALHTKNLLTCRKVFCVYLQAKKQLHRTCFSGHIAQILKLLILDTLGKLIVSTCKRLRCLSAYQKYTSSFSSFLGYFILKNPAIWLVGSILAHNSRTRILSNIGLVVKYQLTILVLVLDYFQEKLKIKFFKKNPKNSKFSSKKALSVFAYSIMYHRANLKKLRTHSW